MSRILFLSRWLPYPPNNGSKLRIFTLLRALARHHEVTLLSFFGDGENPIPAAELQVLCSDVKLVPWKPYNPDSRQARAAFLSSTPRSILDTHSQQMEHCIDEVLSRTKFDAVIASEIDMAAYSRSFHHLPSILEDVEVGTLYEQYKQASTKWRRMRYGLTWAKHRRFLARVLNDFQACTVVSERERQLLIEAVPGQRNIANVPNCINLADYQDVQSQLRADTLIFSGSFTYEVNYRAMTWFLQEVFPLVRAQVPGARLIITGDHAGLPLPSTSNVTLTGFVDDVRPLIAGSWVSLAPIWHGGGTRLKILEAMALSTPVVATSKGAEGLDVVDGEHILLADTPPAFAQAVVSILTSPKLRDRLATNGRSLLAQRYDARVVMPQFLELVARVAKC
jgi:polysaccharide biosynthesis protein PslH